MFDQDNEPLLGDMDVNSEDYYGAEILDEMTTGRGEFKLRSISIRDRNQSRNRSRNNYSFREDRNTQVNEQNPF